MLLDMRSVAIRSLLVLAALAGVPAASQEEPRELLGRGAAFGDSSQTVLAPADTTLHLEPSEEAPVTARLAASVELVVRERRGDWIQVEYEGYLAWLRPGQAAGSDPMSGIERQIEEVRQRQEERRREAAEARARHEARRTRALGIMPEARELRLGTFTLLSELEEGDPRLERLAAVAKHLESTLLRRLGLPAPEERPALLEKDLMDRGLLNERDQVFLFPKQEQYREYLASEETLGGLDLGGHASAGTAALFLGRLDRENPLPGFVHEAVHLVSFRLFGGRIPDWLEEGIAEDLAWSRVAADGRILLDSFDRLGRRTVITTRSRTVRVWIPGELAQVCRAAIRWRGRIPDPRVVVSYGLEDFVDPRKRLENYTLSGLLTRALFSGEDPAIRAQAEKIREPLRALLRGERVDASRVELDESAVAPLVAHIEGQLDRLSGACAALRSR